MARRKKARHGGGGGGGHDGNGMMRWLLTYADMITLLMVFFIMMYYMSVINLAKFEQAASSIRSEFKGVLGGGKHLLRQDGATGKKQREIVGEVRSISDAERRINSYVIQQNLQSKVLVARDKRGLVVNMASDGLLFMRGSAELTPLAITLLTSIEGSIVGLPNNILVEGHTCDIPISTSTYPSNWELSAARACRVVRLLQERGIAGKRLTSVGYGETRPWVANDSEIHRSMNRRVTIVVLEKVERASWEPAPHRPPNDSTPQILPHLRPVLQRSAPQVSES